jgi:hypothetical protein
LFANDAAHNPTAGSHSCSLIQVKIHSPDDGCSNSKAVGAPTPDGFAFVPRYVPRSWTASVGLSNRPVKQVRLAFTSSALSDAQFDRGRIAPKRSRSS